MATRTRNAGANTILPPEIIAFFKRRAVEIFGVIIFVFGAALTICIIGYDSTDPSWNHAVAREAGNPLGFTGAWIADILIQSIGLSAFLPGLVFMVWGWRVTRHLKMGRFWFRFTSLPVALLLSAMAFAFAGAPEVWPVKVGLGGVTGAVLLKDIIPLTEAAKLPLWVLVFALAVFAFSALVCALGISRQEWINGIRNALHASEYSARTSLMVGRWSGRAAGIIVGASIKAFRSIRFSSSNSHTVYELAPNLADDLGGGRREPVLDKRYKTATENDHATASRRKIVAAKRKKPAAGKRAFESDQQVLDLGTGEYSLPPLDVLDEAPAEKDESKQDEEALTENARLLESVLEDFGVNGRIVKVRPGPVVTLYELEPAPGTKSSRVISLADDIARSMSAVSVRVAVVPGKNVIGIELPNLRRELVALRELVESKDYEKHSGALTLVLGKDIGGSPTMVDLARMPHLLIAGTTGSGKSVAVNTMIMSLLYRLTPEQCKFIMIDPKMLELSVYDDIPHLLSPVVTDPAKAVIALRWAVREMEDRYRAMSHLGVRNINGYNQRIADALKKGETLMRTIQTGFDPESGEPIYEEQAYEMKPLPYIVVIVDEMADLMMVAGKEVEAAVQRLAQMARAAGIHLIMATQRPSVDVITGTIKANFPTRISFQVTSKIDSRTILGEGGAEQLLGQGDMLYMAGGGRIGRVHGPFVSDEAVERVVTFMREQAPPEYIDEVTEGEHDSPFIPSGDVTSTGGADEEMYDRAVAVVCRERKASTSFVQRHLQIGYNRAARIIERMEAEGVISKANHAGKRQVMARDIDSRDN
ncbi:MAG: DNA translocase FtsK [Alphaproteobacteria bacterium MarineAlpha11_Bin1]|nr:MAG: DNA translocase FtsK [Alphaproteobacteria bacterium MarineAlpha11_Bin1]|tara:strand:- start:3098 stop:5548 length:2451 start_codon:yes stop_codon:yes gene_type:complete